MSDPTRPRPNQRRSGAAEGPDTGGVRWRRWAFAIAVVLLAIIAIQNSQKVEIKLLFINGEMPLIVGLLIAGVLGAIIGYVTPLALRGRRAERRREG